MSLDRFHVPKQRFAFVFPEFFFLIFNLFIVLVELGRKARSKSLDVRLVVGVQLASVLHAGDGPGEVGDGDDEEAVLEKGVSLDSSLM